MSLHDQAARIHAEFTRQALLIRERWPTLTIGNIVLARCPVCASVVAEDEQAVHEEWHVTIAWLVQPRGHSLAIRREQESQQDQTQQ